MIRIQIYRHMDKTAVQVHLLRPDLGTKARPHPVEYLYWNVFEGLAHDETHQLLQMITEAVEACEMQACEHGGWSMIV